MVSMLVVVFYAQRIKRRHKLGRAVAVRQAACYPFVNLAAKLFLHDALINVDHLLRLRSFLHRTGNNAAGDFHGRSRNKDFLLQRLYLSIKTLLLFDSEAADVDLAEGIAGDNADFIVCGADNTNVNRILRNELTCINDAALLQGSSGEISRIAGHGAGQLMQLGNGIGKLMNRIGTGLRSVAMMTADAGNLDAVFGVALTLSNNAPVRTRNVHDNREVRLLRQLCNNVLRGFGAALLFTVGIIDNLLEILEACFLQRLQAVNNLNYGSLVITNARAPGKVVFIYTEGTACSLTLFENSINVSHEQNSVFSLAMQTRNQVTGSVIISEFCRRADSLHLLCNKFIGGLCALFITIA